MIRAGSDNGNLTISWKVGEWTDVKSRLDFKVQGWSDNWVLTCEKGEKGKVLEIRLDNMSLIEALNITYPN